MTRRETLERQAGEALDEILTPREVAEEIKIPE